MSIFNGFRQGAGNASGNPPVNPNVGAPNSTPGAVPNNGQTAPNSQTTNPTVPSSSTVRSDGSVPSIPKVETTGPTSPLANYADLWKVDPPAAGSNPQQRPSLVPQMNIDAGKIMEAARGMDFTKGIDADILGRAAKGNDAEALAQLISSVAQNAYAQSALATTNIVRSAMEIQDRNFNQHVMPSVLRKFAVSSAVAENPMAGIPAAAPMLQALETQLSTKYPQASPAEIKQHAATYLEGFAQEVVRANGGTIVPKDNPNGNPLGARTSETDWEQYFGVAGQNAS